jgi:hypothetical protein
MTDQPRSDETWEGEVLLCNSRQQANIRLLLLRGRAL